MTLPWQPDQPDQSDQWGAPFGPRPAPSSAPFAPPERAPRTWQHPPGLADLPPLNLPARPPSRGQLPALPTLPAPPAPPRLPAPIPPIDRARVARLDRRALAVVLVCVALLLLGAVAPFAWANYTAGASSQNSANAPQVSAPAPTLPPTLVPPAPTQAPTQAPTLLPTPVPTQAPTVAPTVPPRSIPTTPPPTPTATPPPAPIIQSGALSAPARLTLVCGAPAALPFQNTGDTLLSWSVTMPPGVLVNGWSGDVRGTIAPGGKLVLAITERPGTRAGPAQLILLAPGARLAVALALAAC